MAELVGLAASITGLISLGLQVFEGLKAYTDSAHDSNNRVTGITIDVNLTLEVVKSLATSLNEDGNRAEISAGSVKLGMEVIARCHKLFTEINGELPRLGPSGLRKRDIVKWPFTEPKVNVLRVGLGEVKATLQLWMSVIIMAAMRRRQAGQAILDQQIDLIVKLNEDKNKLAAELASLKASHVYTTPQELSTSQYPELIGNGDLHPTVEDYVETDDEQQVSASPTPSKPLEPPKPLPLLKHPGLPKPPGKEIAISSVSSSSSSIKSNSDLPEHGPSGYEYGSQRGHSSLHSIGSDPSIKAHLEDPELLALREAYMQCSHHLQTARQDLSKALRETFRSSDLAYLAPSYQEEHTYRVLGNLDRSCLQAYHCLKDTILKSPAHTKFRSPYDGVLNSTDMAQNRLGSGTNMNHFRYENHASQGLRPSHCGKHEPVNITIHTGRMAAPISITIPTQQHDMNPTSAEMNDEMNARRYHDQPLVEEMPRLRVRSRSPRIRNRLAEAHPPSECADNEAAMASSGGNGAPPACLRMDELFPQRISDELQRERAEDAQSVESARHRIAQELQQKRAEDVELVEHLLHAWTKLYGEAADDAVDEERPTVEGYPIIEEDANIVGLD